MTDRKPLNWTDDPEVWCDECERGYVMCNGFELGKGDTWECWECGTVYECVEVEVNRRWAWEKAGG